MLDRPEIQDARAIDANAAPDAPPMFTPADPRRLRTRAMVPIAGALVLLLSMCGGAGYLALASRQEAAQAAHEELIDTTTSILREQVFGAEAAQRGFLVTGSRPYLAPYMGSAGTIVTTLNRLDMLLAKEPARADILHTLRDRVVRKLVEMQRTIALADSGQTDAARALVNSDEGLRLTEEIMNLTGSLQKSVGDARHFATRRQARSTTGLMIAIGLAAAGAVLMAALATREVRRHLWLLQKRESQLDRLVASLEARVARRTRALEDTNQRFQIALESSRVTVFSQDSALAYLWISQAFRNMPPEEIVGRTDSDIMPPETAAQLDRLKRGVIANGEPARTELRIDVPPAPLWYDLTLVPTVGAGGAVTGLIGGAVDISERKQFEAHVRLLMRELTHRSKNLLAVIQALMRQTANHSDSIEDFSRRFTARLESLAAAHDLLIKDDWRGTTLEELVRSQLAHYADKQSPQIDISGPALRVPPDATQNIGMALHELATNAAKYGALSVPTGHVSVQWTVAPNEAGVRICRINWLETGGPQVVPPARRGFGQVVIERTVARAVSGNVTLTYNPAGVEWTLVFPATD